MLHVLLLLLFLAALLLSWALTGALVRLLSGASHQALPNERSMHVRPTPVGGGLAIVATVLVLVPLWRGGTSDLGMVLGMVLLLAAVSAADQYTTIWPLTRFAVQGVAVALALSTFADTVRFLPQVPFWAERLCLGVAWVWLINLNNFMDGIDGIAGAEAAAVALGVVAVTAAMSGRLDQSYVVVAVTLAGAALGYLVWNWSPARIFMGDVGSIPIGFLLGWLLLSLAARGAWSAALILPALFVADATITLLRRIANGEKPWRAHRKHFYQRAVRGGSTPPRVVGWLTICNGALLVLAVLSSARPVTAVLTAVLVVLAFLARLALRASPFETERAGAP